MNAITWILATLVTFGPSMVPAWTVPNHRRPMMGKQMLQKVATVATGVSFALATCFAPLTAAAAGDTTAPFTGKYADPKHPNCKREIVVVSPSSGQAKVSGTDGSPGCPPDGSGKAWTLSGMVDGTTILVDFSPKGGPANLKGTYDTSSDPIGIQWPDGNKWAKLGIPKEDQPVSKKLMIPHPTL